MATFTDIVAPAKAIEHKQFPILTHLIKEDTVYLPSRRQARQVVHAIVAHSGASRPPLLDQFVHIQRFDNVNMDQRRDPNVAERFRSVVATDDIVIGTTQLLVCLQVAGQPTFDVSTRRHVAKTALQLDSLLRTWQQRGLDGAGGKATPLAQDEKGWAYVATVDCLAALEVPSVLETLKSVWLENVEATLTSQTWRVRRRLGRGAGKKDWDTHLKSMKEWIEEANSIFEER